MKWFAPILSFTTEEIFQILNQEQNSSIHLQVFPKVPKTWKNDKLFEQWGKFKIILYSSLPLVSNKSFGL